MLFQNLKKEANCFTISIGKEAVSHGNSHLQIKDDDLIVVQSTFPSKEESIVVVKNKDGIYELLLYTKSDEAELPEGFCGTSIAIIWSKR
ncbi:MAG: hypothetical protein Q4D38_08800 [Planctomycetia bacterium]|nr:hypothetical protein [Planctomycetia bacterium]